MTAKLITILLALGLTAIALLSQRQQCIDLAYQITRTHNKCDRIRTDLWDVRCAIAEQVAELHRKEFLTGPMPHDETSLMAARARQEQDARYQSPSMTTRHGG
ncbi:MAG: hypothetical protein MK089_03020 [Phycisphaerales bacterium]|nr:hypothetical protein [Phycisphaerae bacterium]MCH2152290.1 hypothetical protein [Phycisphaerales bacterium]|tara:strand:+ start:275 stop:583 length:309 start_codon:yes stop_codon:yes gene_type:complete